MSLTPALLACRVSDSATSVALLVQSRPLLAWKSWVTDAATERTTAKPIQGRSHRLARTLTGARFTRGRSGLPARPPLAREPGPGPPKGVVQRDARRPAEHGPDPAHARAAPGSGPRHPHAPSA